MSPRLMAPCAALLVLGATVPALASTGSDAPPPGSLTTLTTNVLPGLDRPTVTDLGAAPSDRSMSLVVSLRRPDPAGEDALLAAIYDPRSPSYHHFLTPAEIGQRFGVSAAVRSAARGWLTGAGLSVDGGSTTGDIIDVHGPVSAVQKAFSVTIHSYREDLAGRVRAFVANTAAPSVPTALSVLTVVGLNDYQHLTVAGRTSPAQDTCVAGTCTGATTPDDLRQVYEQPSQYTGAGQSVGVFGEGDTTVITNELRAFEKANKLATVKVTTLSAPGDKTLVDDPGGDGEWQIDTQAERGMAPDMSELRLYFSDDPNLSDAKVLASFTQWESDPAGPHQMDASFGECEALPAGLSSTLAPVNPPAVALPVDIPVIGSSLVAGQGLGNTLEVPGDAVLKLATMEGRTLFSSTGDTGSSCPVVYASGIGAGNGVANQGVPLTSYPASSPYVVGVGGTVLYTNQTSEAGAPVTRNKEYAWTFGGGGDTLFVPLPSWQVGFPTLPCVATPDGTPDPQDTCRGVPDVSAQSGDVLTNGYQLYNADGTTGQGGGTSLSSPLWAGMWARVSSAAAGGSTGFADPAIYTAARDATAYARDFFDVNSADTTGSIPAANGIYAALPGWDYATGLGTPQIDGIICDVDHVGSGRYATGVTGACPAFAAAATAPVAVTKAAVVKKKTVKRTPVKAAAAPSSLAATGLGVGVPLLGGALVIGAVALRRRRV